MGGVEFTIKNKRAAEHRVVPFGVQHTDRFCCHCGELHPFEAHRREYGVEYGKNYERVSKIPGLRYLDDEA